MSVDSLDSNLDLARPVTDRKYVGTVVANEDPLNLDRIQVRVLDLYDPDQGEVPWAGPIKLSPFGQSQDWGVYGVPAIGSDVIIELQDGDPQFPMYESFGRYSNPDFPSGKSWGFKDPKGNKFKVDLEADTVHFNTGSGVIIDISATGAIDIIVPKRAMIDGPDVYVTGNLRNDGTLSAGNGATGTFTTTDGKTIQVQDGIVVNIF